MTEAYSFLRLGVAHLLDPRGLDHVVFIAALTASYGLAERGACSCSSPPSRSATR